MKAPDKIYIDIIDMDSGYMMAPSFENNGGAEYIRKDALLEWLESKVYEHNEDRFDDGFNAALGQVIDKINSL